MTLGELERQLAECDENLCGTKLSSAERVLFTRRRKHAYEALHPETRNGTNQHTRVGKDCQPSFTDDTAARTGQSARTVRLDATRSARINEAVLSDIKGTAQDTGRTLDALAAVPKDQQAAELGRLRQPQNSLAATDCTRDPEDQFAELRQGFTVVDSLHHTLDSAKHGALFPGFLIEAVEKEIWKHPRRLTHNTIWPMALADFVKRPYPTGLGASFELIEKLIAGDKRAMLAWDKAVRNECGTGSAAEAEKEQAKREQHLLPLAQAVKRGLSADKLAELLRVLPQHEDLLALITLLRNSGR